MCSLIEAMRIYSLDFWGSFTPVVDCRLMVTVTLTASAAVAASAAAFAAAAAPAVDC